MAQSRARVAASDRLPYLKASGELSYVGDRVTGARVENGEFHGLRHASEYPAPK